MYTARWAAGKHVCIGLDPDLDQIPKCVPGDTDAQRVFNFLKDIVDATYEYAAAFKPQIGYFEDGVFELEALEVLRQIIDYIRSIDANIPIILDFKRGDIGRTNQPYVREAFNFYMVDAVTVHPYLGMEAMEPFLAMTHKTIIVLCRTSNPGAGEFQDLECIALRDKKSGRVYSTHYEYMREVGGDEPGDDHFDKVHMKLYEFVALRVAQAWNKNDNCIIVVGATYPGELGEIRKLVGDMLILIPGIGTQGGDLAASYANGRNSTGGGTIFNNSSAILFAYLKLRDEANKLKYKPEQFAEASAEAAKSMNDAVATLVAA